MVSNLHRNLQNKLNIYVKNLQYFNTYNGTIHLQVIILDKDKNSL